MSSLKQFSMKLCDLSGQKFNRLTVMNLHSSAKDGKPLWKCICECGNVCVVIAANLKSRTTQSCGCLCSESITIRNLKHGLKHHPLYTAWRGIKARCLNIKTPCYKHYGGRGITICPEWINSESFINWGINNGWKKGLQIDRIDNNGNYEPSNCRFVTNRENQLNKRNNRLLSYGSTTKTISEWVSITGISHCLIRYRLKKGMSVEDAITKPVRKL